MMKSYVSLAWKELKAQKVTAVLILLAVILSSIMTTAIGQSLGILKDMRVKQASSLNGDRYASFHQLSEEQMKELSADPRIVDAGSMITVGSLGLKNSGLTLFMREYLGNALDAYPSVGKVKEGRLPAAPNEIALPEDVLKYFQEKITVGSTITLDAGISLMNGSETYRYTAEFTVSGILKANYLGYATGSVDAILGPGTANMLLPAKYLLYSTDFKVADTKHFQDTVNDLAQTLGVDEAFIQYNWILLDALGIDYSEKGKSDTETGFSFMALAFVLVGILVLAAAGLVIYNILKIAVTKRIREYGTLRAIGGERGQIYRLVSLQLFILCGIGIPIGLLFGILSAKGILIAATSILNPDLFLTENTSELSTAISTAGTGSALYLLVSIAVTLGFAMLAAFPAARYAARVSPTTAMSGQSVKIKRRIRKKRKIHSFEAYYARLNLRRGRGRTVITILSLVMSITVFVALKSFTALLDTSSSVKDMHLGDYAVTNEGTGISPEGAKEIREHEAVENLSTTKLTVYMQDESGSIPINLDFELKPGETFQLAGIDDARLKSHAEDLSEDEFKDLLEGRSCIVKNPIAISFEGKTAAQTNLKKGDVITINNVELTIAGIADTPVTINNEGFLNGVQVVVSDETYDILTGKEQYSEVYPALHKGADTKQFEAWLKDWCDSHEGSHFLSYRQSDAQLSESFEQIKMLCWGLILFIGLIGILNIINTVYSNIHTRVPEIGMQRAIGMSAGSLYKTFLWEGAYYGIFASIIGGILGYICTIFVNAASTDTIQLTAFPLIPVLEAAAIAIAACLLATAVPLRSISRMSIVDSIETVE